MAARTPTPGDADPVDVAELSYASAGAELDGIIQEFEAGVVDVDRLVGQLERAADIVDELDRRLRRTRMRVEELVPRLEAVGREDEAVLDEAGSDGPTGEPGPDGGSATASPGLF